MSAISHDDFFAAISTHSLVAEIDRRILLTENNMELAALAATLISKALNILTLFSPSDTLKSTINDSIDKKGDRYKEFVAALEALTSVSSLLK